ncbi:MAG TPA: type II secretion system protein GspE [Nitrospirales bacterium]|nr:type II secretion system protein GspE [Nitrospirales bacterium]HIC05052.1 type II secretion system protein GspE [Nitrospirales bacterium]
MSITDDRLSEILQDKYSVDPARIEASLEVLREKGGRLSDILLNQQVVREGELLEALSLQYHLPHRAHLRPPDIEFALVSRVPIAFAKRYVVLPIRVHDDVVEVATADPLNFAPLDDLRILLDHNVQPVLSTATTIMGCINQVYDQTTSNRAEQAIEDMSVAEDVDASGGEWTEPLDLLDATDEAPMIRLVNSILYQSARQRASDIHLEPFEREVLVRYRIDGVLYNNMTLPRRLHPGLVSRVKIMAGLNIAEKRLPQDGRLTIRTAGREIDLRVSVIPTAFGERVVLRLLEKGTRLFSFADLGLTNEKKAVIDQLIRMSHGILLVTGPTGSGKTTTLYTGLSQINTSDRNIITIEDPVEYQLTGIGQMQVNAKINMTFANGLRAILRQDPDVIMVGEIRDRETADIAIHASLTGHLVLSTLHTNDAAGAVTRLIDMDVEPFLVSSSVAAVIAQRLVRVLCAECRQPTSLSHEELVKLGLDTTSVTTTIYRAVGCDACMKTGYRGRQGIYEILLVDDDIRALILAKTDSTQIQKLAVKKGMTTLAHEGALKVLEGVTTVEEVLRVTLQDVAW